MLRTKKKYVSFVKFVKGGLEDKTNRIVAAPTVTYQKPSSFTGGNPISELFEDQLHTDLFNARCHDTGETTNGNIQVHLFHFS